ncbi:hypothetical protein FWF89_02420 [Candidatus Saccharibacteria bacterium]|nr:hypothetical protein [Candidatus Saccharibacteria bacterium]
MKGSSLATVVLIAIISTIVAALVVNAILGDPNEESVTVSYMDVISTDVIQPDREVFNNRAVNPTVEVYVGECRPGEVWDEDRQACVEAPEGDESEAGNDEAEE